MSSMQGIYYTVKVLVHQFFYLRENDAQDNAIISNYWGYVGKATVTDVDTRVSIQRVVINIDLA